MSITNPSAEVAKRWKRSDVLKYLKSKQDEMDLDDEDIRLLRKIRSPKITPPYNLLGGPAGTIALLIKALNGEVQVPASLQEPETSEDFEKTRINELPHNPISTSEENSVGTHLPENDLPEATRINKQSHDLVNTEHDLQIAKAIEKTHDPISISEEVDAHLPEIASGLLRYYELWNCHYTKWPGLNEFSNHLRDVNKDRVHNSFKREINVLRKLFADEHPAQMHLSQLEAQLKASCVLVGKLCA
ncbi:3325_t:CDS:2 [Paraglomus occultum]|uniref:3325_t:CDS:1 n=1 Tax=Paraglomus occultum TaxID=144539 RepID=A0A9N9GLN9_9GLOM|nr:3325_t:CDS:2 [Paraglomus occultum]